MTVLWLVVIPWLSVSVLASLLLVVAGVRKDRARRAALERHPAPLQARRVVREAEDLLRSGSRRAL